MSGEGILCLVVGASGAGKDMLLDAIRTGRDPGVTVLRRVVTRPQGAGAETHEALDEAAFEAARQAGRFLLAWRAHGLCYGLPAAPALQALAAGHLVLANVSRGAVGEAEGLGVRLAIVHVRASPCVLAERLAARGREREADIVARLARPAPRLAVAAPVHEIWNDGAPEEAARRFAALVSSLKSAL